MRALLALPMLVCLSASATEFNTVDADHSSLVFVYRQMGVPVDGRFRKFSAQISFDPARTNAARAVIAIDLASVDTGSAEGDDAVAGKSWFDSKAFPVARFVSSAIKPLGGARYQVTGSLAIKGHTQEISAPFTFSAQAGKAAFDGSLTLRRADFAIGEGEWSDFDTVANDVQIKFHILAVARP